MSLDNRSKVLVVSGENLGSEANQQTLREWYESTGGKVSASNEGMLVTYSSREMAENVSCGNNGHHN